MNGLLIDITKCIGCNACRAACREKNSLPDLPISGKEAEPLRAGLLTVVQKREVLGSALNVRRMCMSCIDPTCVSVCIVGAFQKTAAGPVTYDANKCIGCRYCMLACPFSVPTYEWGSTWPKVNKCNLCADLVAAGKQTACAEACPTGATLFGERSALIREAHHRIAENPKGYVDHIYGLEEVGGTCVMYLSPVPFDQIGFRTNLQLSPLPILTYRVLDKTPHVFGLGSTVLGGLYWITHRREEVSKAEGAGKGGIQ
jgi:formate dehydrogenase iron-sulfur subunit